MRNLAEKSSVVINKNSVSAENMAAQVALFKPKLTGIKGKMHRVMSFSNTYYTDYTHDSINKSLK